MSSAVMRRKVKKAILFYCKAVIKKTLWYIDAEKKDRHERKR